MKIVILPESPPIPSIWSRLWRLTLLAWFVILGTFVCRGLLGLLGKRSPDEALMFIQDVFWRETRGEQRRIFKITDGTMKTSELTGLGLGAV